MTEPMRFAPEILDRLRTIRTPRIETRRVAAASRGYETKYAGDPAVRSMVADHVLPTTLELKPR